MKKYLIRYRRTFLPRAGSASLEVREFRCMAWSEVEALMRLVNLKAVHQVFSVEKV